MLSGNVTVFFQITFLHQPFFLLLDEPTNSLDDESARLFLNNLSEWRRTTSGLALIASHDIERISELATKAILLNSGVLTFDSNAAIETVIDTYRRVNA